MKRTRALESRQYRRTVKKSKFTESVYFNTSTFGYLKLFSIWISCITFDLLVGCRLELGWPILLFVRRYSEIVGAPNGTLRFHSTFSIFYLFLTITSDLVCYLFLPVQQLLFLASTYVWLQFTYQTVDRGLSPAVIGFCVLFVCFEYFLRYQITSPQWYESRSLLLTASLLPTVTDAFLANQMSTTRLALYRIFASHSLGFPLVTFGFRFKNIISDWLYEKRREDVQKKNEIFDKILTEAIPMVYEGKKRHEFNTRQHLALEGEVLDFELDPTGSDFLEEPKYSLPSNGPVPSIFDKLGNGPTPPVPVRPSIDSLPFSRKTSKAKLKSNGLSKSVKHKASTSSMTLRSNGQSHSSIVDEEPNNNQINEDDETSLKQSPTLSSASSWLINFIQSFFVNWLLSALVVVRSTGNSVVEHAISVSNGVRSDAMAVMNGIEPDDSISTSGDGSQNAEDEESDRESVMTNTMDSIDKNGTIRTAQNGWSNSNGQTKKKGKKNRGRTPTNVTDLPEGEFELQYPTDELVNGKGRKIKPQTEEKKDDELERLKLDLRGAKLIESELREQIAGFHQYEKSAKNEVQQYKVRYEQLDVKYKTLLKQQEQTKTTINNLEKKIGEMQNRKDQLEKELMIERSAATKNNMADTKTNDSMVETMKTKIVKLENDLKKIRLEYRTKEDLSIKLETKLKEMQNQKSVAQKTADDGSVTVTRLELENAQLKKALSEENRVKQDLFLALKTSKAKIDNLQTKLKSLGIVEESEQSNMASNSNGAVSNDLFRLSPSTSSSSPPPPFGSRLPDLDSSFMGGLYSYSSGLSGIRSSPSDFLRDSPTTNLGQMLGTPTIGTPQHHNATTTHSN
uniref:Macoilin n=1 Tax=Panagrolaimus sp. JU765 TaxID=591449 RepID=A0AC34QVZ5_9BILA